MRLNKYIAHTGYCSRRAADKLIKNGDVSINDEGITDFNFIVNKNDKVLVNRIKLSLPKVGIWLYHKPPGLITSKKDTNGRQTVFENLPKNVRYLISIGRLDFNTEGLLLMTNNGDLAQFMTHPKNNIPRRYEIKAFGNINESKFKLVGNGVTINHIKYKPVTIKTIISTGNNHWFSLILTEGKNREVRNIFNFLELKIDRLIRTEYGVFQLKNLQPNNIIKASAVNVEKYMRLM